MTTDLLQFLSSHGSKLLNSYVIIESILKSNKICHTRWCIVMNVITRINGRKIIPVSDSMQAIFPFGEIGFPCQLYHDNICNFHENNVNWHWQNELEFMIHHR